MHMSLLMFFANGTQKADQLTAVLGNTALSVTVLFSLGLVTCPKFQY